MTKQTDMERAKDICQVLSDWNVGGNPNSGYYTIDKDGVARISKLIAEVRDETLEAAEAKIELELEFRENDIDKKSGDLGRIIGLQDALVEIRSLKSKKETT